MIHYMAETHTHEIHTLKRVLLMSKVNDQSNSYSPIQAHVLFLHWFLRCNLKLNAWHNSLHIAESYRIPFYPCDPFPITFVNSVLASRSHGRASGRTKAFELKRQLLWFGSRANICHAITMYSGSYLPASSTSSSLHPSNSKGRLIVSYTVTALCAF